jgi:hypothetical protein
MQDCWSGVSLKSSNITDIFCLSFEQKALGRPMWPHYYNLIEPNANKLVKGLYEEGLNGKEALDMFPWLRQVGTILKSNLNEYVC